MMAAKTPTPTTNPDLDRPTTPEASWALPVDVLQVQDVPGDAINLNIDGRRLTGPLSGFGQMWQKTYRIRLSGSSASPEQVIATWKQNFPQYWPKGNIFYLPSAGIKPGQIGLINAGLNDQTAIMASGVMVIYADATSFTFMTPEGHAFAGWVTFSAYEQEGATVAQTQVLIRASDPLYEIGFRLGILHNVEDQIWHNTLLSLAHDFGVQGQVTQQTACVDPRVQWSHFKDLRHNAMIHSVLHAPVTIFRKLFPA